METTETQIKQRYWPASLLYITSKGLERAAFYFSVPRP